MAKKLIAIFIAMLGLVTVSIGNSITEGPNRVIKEHPIVINTVAKHYENPTIDEYQLCTKSRDDCLAKCRFRDEKCNATCPICPILVDQDALVQGINDTLYRLPPSSGPVNQTTIIRLTNEIRNIIETNLGNITANTENLVNVYQNRTSRTGGKYGVGYNENGSCCHLIEPRRCRRTASGRHCLPRRVRTCGPHCVSRVMRAKRVVTCSELDPSDCSPKMEYIPQLRRTGCQYTSRWPFIRCPTRSTPLRRPSCGRCFKIPYMNVMRGQIPRDCLSCFNRGRIHHRRIPMYRPEPMHPYPVYQTYDPYYPAFPEFEYDWPMNYDDEDLYYLSASEVKDRKCTNENGTVSESCLDSEVKEDDKFHVDNSEPTEDYESEEVDVDEDDEYAE